MSTAIMDCERPISETYSDVEEIMFAAIRRAINKWGGDWEDWHCYANEVFMKAYTRWKPGRGTKFTTWFNFFLNVLFTEKVRREAMRNARLPRVHIDFEEHDLITKNRWSIEQFMVDLGEDAQMVVMLVLDPSLDFKLSMVDKDRRVNERDYILDSLTEFLSDIGWDSNRIWDTFDEVSSALC